jgi:hypothetical protein
MANIIKHKRSSSAGVTPSVNDIQQSELAINIADGKLYTKNTDNNIINLGVTTISGTYITPASGSFNNDDSSLSVDNNGISILTNINKDITISAGNGGGNGQLTLGISADDNITQIFGGRIDFGGYIQIGSPGLNYNIGIGTSTPSAKLDVDGDILAEQINIESTDSGATLLSIEGTNGNLFSVVDSVSGSLLSVNDITGLPAFEVFSDHSIVAGRFNANDFVVSSGGGVGMGTATPSGKLDVAGDVYVRGTGNNLGTIYFKSQAVGDKTLYVGATNGGDLVLNGGGANLQLSSQGGYANLFASSTQLHIGHGYDAGNAFQTIRFFPAAKEMMRMTTSGTLGIGLPTSTSSYAGNSVQLFNQQPYANTRVHIAGSGADSGSAALIVTNSGISPLLYVRNDGNVGVGTTTPSYKLQVNGSFGATTKSFRIDHPSRPDYTLEYGSLESPYHGVRLTGRGRVVKGVGVVDLPPYLKDLIHDDENINIQLTNLKHGKTLYVSNIDLNNSQFVVKADRAKTVGDLEFFWTFTGVRKDVDHLVVEKPKEGN